MKFVNLNAPSGIKNTVLFKLYEAGEKPISLDNLTKKIGSMYAYSDIPFTVIKAEVENIINDFIVKSAIMSKIVKTDEGKSVTGFLLTSNAKLEVGYEYNKQIKIKAANLSRNQKAFLREVQFANSSGQTYNVPAQYSLDERAKLKQIYEPLYEMDLIAKPKECFFNTNIFFNGIVTTKEGRNVLSEFEATKEAKARIEAVEPVITRA